MPLLKRSRSIKEMKLLVMSLVLTTQESNLQIQDTSQQSSSVSRDHDDSFSLYYIGHCERMSHCSRSSR